MKVTDNSCARHRNAATARRRREKSPPLTDVSGMDPRHKGEDDGKWGIRFGKLPLWELPRQGAPGESR